MWPEPLTVTNWKLDSKVVAEESTTSGTVWCVRDITTRHNSACSHTVLTVFAFPPHTGTHRIQRLGCCASTRAMGSPHRSQARRSTPHCRCRAHRNQHLQRKEGGGGGGGESPKERSSRSLQDLRRPSGVQTEDKAESGARTTVVDDHADVGDEVVLVVREERVHGEVV